MSTPGHRRHDWVVAAMVFDAAVIVAVVRWWTSRGRDVFHMNPDEPGQLAIARFVGGGTRWNMFDHSTWRPGYGTLISPITWFTDDPSTGFRAAIVVNALLGGVSCVLLYLLARALTSLSTRWCIVAAVAVSLAPSLLFTTDWVWSEALVQVTYLAFLLSALRFLAQPSVRWGVATCVLAAAGFASHSRLLPLSAAVVAVVVVATFRHRLSRGRGIGLVALMVALDIAVSRYSHWVVSRVWDAPRATNTAGGVAARLGKVTPILASTFGQIWYQLVATAGIAGFGALALARAARRRTTAPADDAGRRARPTTDDARLVLGTAAALIALSIVFMADRWRPDQLVYGRYNDVAMAPILVVGIGALVTARSARLLRDLAIVLTATVVSGVVLRVFRDDELRAAGAVRSMMLGLLGYLGHAAEIRVIGITLTGALLMTGLVLLAVAARGRAHHALVLVALVVLVAGGYARTRPVIDRGTNSWDIADGVRGVTEVLPSGAVVRERLVPASEDPLATWGQQRLRSMQYQFYLPTNPLIRDGDGSGAPWTPYVFAPVGDPDLVASGAEVLWRDPGVPMALWKEPGPPAEATVRPP